MKTISRKDLQILLADENKPVLVEALPENFYAKGHLPGAISIPPGKVVELSTQMLPDKAKTIVVYCSGAGCQNSMITAEELRVLGYTDVRRYTEGKDDWRGAGLPLEIGYA